MGAGLKKDLRVSRVGPGGSLNAFFFLLIGIFSQRFAMVRKKEEQAHLESAVQRIVVCCVKRIEMHRPSEPLLSCCVHPINPTPFHGWLYVRSSPLSMATFDPLWKMVRCGVTAWLIVWRHHRCQWLCPILLVKMVRCAVTTWLII
ncbi:hypothetical protein AHAS_Ahas10G0142400 [Arachis hypogaea]|uniref:Uncharacterized protein n=1 Tax=Arachis hypogaea TaxID=3818 RepID=A0A445B6T9_ARAHY|nr:hypothetical protein Ahy_A10g049194 [Arachis hypogaea]